MILVLLLSSYHIEAEASAKYSRLECVANAQSIALDFGSSELNKQITLSIGREKSNDFHRWLVQQATEISSKKSLLVKFNQRVSDYRLDSYERRMGRAGYCLQYYL